MNRGFSLSLLSISVLFLLPGLAQAVPSGSPNPLAPDTFLQAGQQYEDIRDIVGPVELQQTTPYLYYGLAALCTAIMAALLLVFFLKRKKERPLRPAAPADTALKKLDHAESRLAETGTASFATEVSNILRHYLEQAFKIPSTTQTTTEFFTSVSAGVQSGLLINISAHTESLEKCLSLCDQAKYAAVLPALDEAEQLSQEARAFITGTKPGEGTE